MNQLNPNLEKLKAEIGDSVVNRNTLISLRNSSKNDEGSSFKKIIDLAIASASNKGSAVAFKKNVSDETLAALILIGLDIEESDSHYIASW